MENLTEPISPEDSKIPAPPRFRELVQKKLDEAKKQKEQMIRSTDSLPELASPRALEFSHYERERKLLMDMLAKSQQAASIAQQTYEAEKQRHLNETEELRGQIKLLEEENRMYAGKEFENISTERPQNPGISSEKLIEELYNLEKCADQKEKFYKEEIEKFKQELKSRDEKIKFLSCENEILLDDIKKTSRKSDLMQGDHGRVSIVKIEHNRRNVSKSNTPVNKTLPFPSKSKPATPTKVSKELTCGHYFEIQALKATIENLKAEVKKLEKDQINLMKISNEREANLSEEVEKLRTANNKLVEINQAKEQAKSQELEKLTETIKEMQQSFNTREKHFIEAQEQLKKENQDLANQLEELHQQKEQLKSESFSSLKDEIKALRESHKVISSLPKDTQHKSKLEAYKLKINELESNIQKLKDFYIREKSLLKSEMKHRAELVRKENSQVSIEIETLATAFSGNDIMQVFLEEVKKYESMDLSGLVMLGNELCEQRNWEQQMLLNMSKRVKEGPKGLNEDLDIYLSEQSV